MIFCFLDTLVGIPSIMNLFVQKAEE